MTITALDLESVLCTQSCLTLCEPMDCSHQAPLSMGIFQARILEWVVMPSSRDLPNPGMEPRSPTLQADSLLLSHQSAALECQTTEAVLTPFSQVQWWVSDNRSCINSFFTGSVVDHLTVECHLQLPHPVSPPFFYSFPCFLSPSLVSAP